MKRPVVIKSFNNGWAKIEAKYKIYMPRCCYRLSLFHFIDLYFFSQNRSNKQPSSVVVVLHGQSDLPNSKSISSETSNIAIPRYFSYRYHQYNSDNTSNTRGLVAANIPFKEQDRDPAWADDTEIKIKNALINIPYIDILSIVVTCKSDICKAQGDTKAGLSLPTNNDIGNYVSKEMFYTNNLDNNFIPNKSIYRVEDNMGHVEIEFSRITK